MTSPYQLLIVLDVNRAVETRELETLLPDRRSGRTTLLLSQFGCRPSPGATQDTLNWSLLTAALAQLRSALQEESKRDAPLDVYVSGFAPLSLFFALGSLLDPREGRVVFIQPQRLKTAGWQLLDLTAGAPPVGPPESRPPTPEPSDATGQVALFLSTIGLATPRDAIRDAVQDRGGDLAGIAVLATDATPVTPDNVAELVRDLAARFVRLTGEYPHRSGTTVFLAGPAAMAVAAGLAVNPNQHLAGGLSLDLTEYVGSSYFHSLRLPLEVAPDTTVPTDAAAVLARLEAFRPFRRGVEKLKERLTADAMFMPSGFGGRAPSANDIAARAHSNLKNLTLPDTPEGQVFGIDSLTDELTIGHGLLHALRDLDTSTLERLGQLFTLHEVVHADQGVESHNYRGIGRSGVALEDIDFWADAFAIGTAALHAIARNGDAGAERASDILCEFIDAHIEAMRAFDRMEQASSSLQVLPERRLRRYLIWYLQRARAQKVRSVDHVRELLEDRLFVELAPLRGHLDARFDKIVEAPLQSTTLTVALGGRAKRIPALPQNFEPSDLVDDVRHFRTDGIATAMKYVVAEHRELLLPWAT